MNEIVYIETDAYGNIIKLVGKCKAGDFHLPKA